VGVQLYPLFQELRFYIAKLDVPTIRESLAAKLMAAIDDVHKRPAGPIIAKNTKKRSSHCASFRHSKRFLSLANQVFTF